VETTTLPETKLPGTGQGDHCVIIFNNDTNSFDEVIYILRLATGCSPEEAAMETWEAHHRGQAYVHFADRDECERVAAIIRSIGVRTVVEEF
jgi:ATP-dependent Clp protease adapter protein ClpS